ncbi:SHUGOSHIN 1-like isoform X2 [Andrographis paniculata]|uniref:SHUGOSHIN 1-like isoform X2 n=1 Tax=Andrographis paniculata TaxID=175694 RepID=UPI0021E79F63|nr:SHUGOSHIN 1-like isoform X2 [Andrographis paniculata]
MSKKDGFRIVDTQNAAITAAGVQIIGDKGFGEIHRAVGRKKLADISNLPQKQRLVTQENKLEFVDSTTKEYIDQLKKENMEMVKILAQRNKIIELGGAELDRLRVNIVKMQDQNQQLALTNSQLVSELNTGKEQLKVLQHELQCINGSFKARTLQLEEKEKDKQCKNTDAEMLIKFREEDKSSNKNRHDAKHCRGKLSSQPSTLVSGTSIKLQSEHRIGSKRCSTRRQSIKFNDAELGPPEKSSETDHFKPLPGNFPSVKKFSSENASMKNDGNNGASDEMCDSQTSGRSSSCRPTRQASVKVRSYKEISLKVKMRRPE